jgi:TadE-like protein
MKWTDRKNKGQSVLEFMLVAFPLFLLLFGMAEFSRAWWTVSILTDASREAVRIYATDPAGAGLATVRAAAITAQVAPHPPVLPDPVPPVELSEDGEAVIATQRYNFRSVVGDLIPGLNNYPLRSTTSMRKEWTTP